MSESSESPQRIKDSMFAVPESGVLHDLIKLNPRLAHAKRLDEQQLPPPTKPRLTVLETVYHQEPNAEAVSFQSSFSVELHADEQPWLRKLTVGPIPVTLKNCWVETVSELCIRNDTEAEHPRDAKHPAGTDKNDDGVVDVCFDGGKVLCVRPGRSCRFEPANLRSISLMCRCGSAKLTVLAFPQ